MTLIKMNKKSNLVYGTDPEKFAGYKKDGELYVLPPAYFRHHLEVQAMEPESKHPVFIDQMKELGVIVMEDGVAFEYTVRPDTDWTKLFDRVSIADRLLETEILSKFPGECLPEVQCVPTINYDVERWSQEKKQMQMCLIFGCDQDYNALNYSVKNKVVNALKHPFRYGGGHIHVSGSPKIKEEPLLAIQSLIFTAGLAAVAFSDTPDLDKMRTFLYGKPDKFRPQRYNKLFNDMPDTDFGVEYRTPSNRWTNSFEHASQIFKWVEIGIHNLLEGGLVLDLLKTTVNDACEAILACDQPKAKEILSFVESRI